MTLIDLGMDGSAVTMCWQALPPAGWLEAYLLYLERSGLNPEGWRVRMPGMGGAVVAVPFRQDGRWRWRMERGQVYDGTAWADEVARKAMP